MSSPPVSRGGASRASASTLAVIPRPRDPRETYLIMDCPSDKTLPSYMPTLAEQGVRHVVRVSGQAHAYDTAPLADAGIRVHDGMRFDDGTPPPPHVVSSWLALVERTFDVGGSGGGGGKRSPRGPAEGEGEKGDRKSIACHCVSGIGRAPVLVALALVEFDGMDPLEAVELVRKRRRGALNKQQLQWLSTYKRGRWRKTKAPASPLPLPPPGRPSGAKRTLFFACCGGGDHV